MKRLFVFAVAAVFFLPTAALASGPNIDIGPGFKYTPADQGFSFNEGTIWTNKDSIPHTTTSDVDGLWDSDDLAAMQTFSYTFHFAGTFGYHCTIHGAALMHGIASVPVLSSSPTAAAGAPVTITWAVVAIPAGFHMDVQEKKPHKDYKTVFPHQTDVNTNAHLTFNKPGKYKFRARLVNESTGQKTPYSPVLVQTVTP